MLGVVVLFMGCSPQAAPPLEVPKLDDQLAQGKAVYEMACAQCHYDGEGSTSAPDLRRSAILSQSPAALARIILKGQSRLSMVNGKKFDGTMPAQAYLTDEEAAAVIAFVRDAYGGKREAVSPAEVAKIRGE